METHGVSVAYLSVCANNMRRRFPDTISNQRRWSTRSGRETRVPCQHRVWNDPLPKLDLLPHRHLSKFIRGYHSFIPQSGDSPCVRACDYRVRVRIPFRVLSVTVRLSRTAHSLAQPPRNFRVDRVAILQCSDGTPTNTSPLKKNCHIRRFCRHHAGVSCLTNFSATTAPSFHGRRTILYAAQVGRRSTLGAIGTHLVPRRLVTADVAAVGMMSTNPIQSNILHIL